MIIDSIAVEVQGRFASLEASLRERSDVGIGLRRLQFYIIEQTARGVIVSLSIITIIVWIISFEELIRRFHERNDVGLGLMAEIVLLESPVIILTLLPFVFLFGTLAAFASLNRRGELIAMRAIGVSAWQFIGPAAGLAFLFGVVTVGALNPVAARLCEISEDLKSAIVSGESETPEFWLRQGNHQTQIVIHAARSSMAGGVVWLGGVSLFVVNSTPSGQQLIPRRIEASEARLDHGYWRLSGVLEALPGSRSIRSQTVLIPSSLDRITGMGAFINSDLVDFWRLPDTIRQADASGISSASYRFRWHELVATPFTLASMALLGAAFSLRMVRLGGLVRLSVASVAIGFALYILDRACGALAATDVFPAAIGAWTPPAIALLSGVTLLCYTEDG